MIEALLLALVLVAMIFLLLSNSRSEKPGGQPARWIFDADQAPKARKPRK
jgi:hypothetical protein